MPITLLVVLPSPFGTNAGVVVVVVVFSSFSLAAAAAAAVPAEGSSLRLACGGESLRVLSGDLVSGNSDTCSG